MKGKMVLENKIAKILKNFGIKKVYMSDGFYYADDFVYFTPFETAELATLHRNWIKKHFNVSISEDMYFLFSLLHEVGHHLTIDFLTDEELKEEMFFRKMLTLCDEPIQTLNEAYFNLSAELYATEWALWYIENNIKWCNKMQNKIAEALRHFGNINGWEI